MKTPLWLESLLSHPQITDICLNGPDEIFTDRGSGLEAFVIQDPSERFDHASLKNWVLHQLSGVGKTWDAKFPFIDASLPTGHRLHLTFPPLSRNGILVSLRRQAQSKGRVEKDRWRDSGLYFKLADAVRKGDSVLISGATGSGKTTLASDLLEEVSPLERIIALEDTAELNPYHPHFISLLSRPPNADGFGEITLRTLLKQTLRMRPDRIVLGECRGSEVLELLQALNTGHRGALATLHANSPRDVLRRLELLCLIAAQGSIPITVIRELISLGVQWVAQVKKEGQNRKIVELWQIVGREGDTILMRPVLDSILK